MNTLFAYGTLKSGFPAHHLLADSKFVGESITHSRYHLINVGWFPAMIEDPSKEGGVVGELYHVDDSIFDKLDHYEGVRSGLFARLEIELKDERKAIAYLFMAKIEGCKVVENGVWE